jgi:hypothetical protein
MPEMLHAADKLQIVNECHFEWKPICIWPVPSLRLLVAGF